MSLPCNSNDPFAKAIMICVDDLVWVIPLNPQFDSVKKTACNIGINKSCIIGREAFFLLIMLPTVLKASVANFCLLLLYCRSSRLLRGLHFVHDSLSFCWMLHFVVLIYYFEGFFFKFTNLSNMIDNDYSCNALLLM